MQDEHYDDPVLANLYDLSSPWSEDRDYYLKLAIAQDQPVLDLGCGTGMMAVEMARAGCDVTGVDPSASMLDIARQRSGGQGVRWVHSTAEAFHSSRRFGFIYMTGHAFQALLEDEAVHGLFSMVRDHLAPDGRFVFDSRNPDFDWPALWHNRQRTFESEHGQVMETVHVEGWHADSLRFDLHYDLPDHRLTSHSINRFLPRDQIEDIANQSGLQVVTLQGDWDGSQFYAERSAEMIFSMQLI